MPDIPDLGELINLADDLRQYRSIEKEAGDVDSFTAGLPPQRQSRLFEALGNANLVAALREGKDPFSLVAEGRLLPPGAGLVNQTLPLQDRLGEGVGTGLPSTQTTPPKTAQPTLNPLDYTPKPQAEAFVEPKDAQGNPIFPYLPTNRQAAIAFLGHGIPQDIAKYKWVLDAFGARSVLDSNNQTVTGPEQARVMTYYEYRDIAQKMLFQSETQLPPSGTEMSFIRQGEAYRAALADQQTQEANRFRLNELNIQDRLASFREETHRRFQAAESERDRALRQGELDVARKQHEEAQSLSKLSLLLNFLSSLGSQPQLIYTLGQSGVLGKLGESVGFDLSSLVPPQTGQTQLPNPEQLDRMTPMERQRLLAQIAAQTGMSIDQIMAEIQRQAPTPVGHYSSTGGVPQRVTSGR